MTDKPKAKLFERLKLPDNCRDVSHKYVGKIFVMRPAPIDIPGDYGDIAIIDAPAKPQQSASPKPPNKKRRVRKRSAVSETDGGQREE